jgi:hypothetical protein
VNGYLRTRQRDHPEEGCVLPTLAAEIACSSPEVPFLLELLAAPVVEEKGDLL